MAVAVMNLDALMNAKRNLARKINVFAVMQLIFYFLKFYYCIENAFCVLRVMASGI